MRGRKERGRESDLLQPGPLNGAPSSTRFPPPFVPPASPQRGMRFFLLLSSTRWTWRRGPSARGRPPPPPQGRPPKCTSVVAGSPSREAPGQAAPHPTRPQLDGARRGKRGRGGGVGGSSGCERSKRRSRRRRRSGGVGWVGGWGRAASLFQPDTPSSAAGGGAARV